MIRDHVPWTRVVRDGPATSRRAVGRPARVPARASANASSSSRTTSTAAPASTLGWETSERDWDAAIARALSRARARLGRAGADRVRREIFPVCEQADGSSSATCWSTSRRISSAASVAGFLTRLSATGLANVTSGGGQVPAFVVARLRDERPGSHRADRDRVLDRSLAGARARARATPSKSASAIQPRRARRADRRRGEPRGRRQPRRRARRRRRARPSAS